jgi:hypothetical protein
MAEQPNHSAHKKEATMSAVDDNSDLSVLEIVAAVQPQVDALDAAGAEIDGVFACPVSAEE